MKRNKWIVIGIVLLTILTPRVAFAKGFHDDGGGDFGGGGHIEFHADEYLISVGPDLSLISHDHFYDGEGSVIIYYYFLYNYYDNLYGPLLLSSYVRK